MNNFRFDRDSLELYYYRFKDSPYFPLAQASVILLVAIMLLVQAIIPQLSNWFSINAEIAATRERIATLEGNISFVNRLDDNELDEDMSTVFTAVPSEKDFQGVVEAVNGAVVQSGVLVEDYNFQIGEISSQSADLSTFFPVLFNINLTSDIETSRRFFEKLQESLPVAEVVSMKLEKDTSVLSLAFYFKAFPKENYEIGAPIKPLSNENKKLLATLKSRKENLILFDDQVASSSAEPPF